MSATFFEKLRYAKTGIVGPRMTDFDKMQALALFGGTSWPEITLTGAPPLSYTAKGQPLTAYTAKGAMTQAAEQQYTLSGVPPLSFSAKGTALSAYSVTGNMSQTGTPTPAQPIVPEECGDRTAQLFDINGTTSYVHAGVSVSDGEIVFASPLPTGNAARIYYAKQYAAGQYTVSAEATGNVGTIRLFSPIEFSGGTYNSYYGGYFQDIPENGLTVDFTESFTIGFIAGRRDGRSSAGGAIKNIMLNTGTTAQPYVPYGYAIPLSCSGTTYPLYLSEPLRKIGDYADSVDSSGVVTRRIEKVVYDGTEENWTMTEVSGVPVARIGVPHTASTEDNINRTPVCTHYIGMYANSSGTCRLINSITAQFADSANAVDSTTWKAWLAAQNANGTPLCLWYVLATAQTETTTAPTITPASGSNTLSVGTTLNASAVSLTTVGGVAPYNPIQPAFAGTADGGGYKLTFTNAGNSYPISMTAPLRKAGDAADELSSSGTITRAIKELALTGTENWIETPY